MKKEMENWMKENWGNKCEDYEKDCALCKAWKCYEYLFEWEEEESGKEN